MAAKDPKKSALAYLRTNSPKNVGDEKASDKRQFAVIKAYAKRAGFEIVMPPYYDATVSGPDPIERRPGFARMLVYLLNHSNVRTILVESAHRFAREVIMQETGYWMLKGRGIDLVAVDHPESFAVATPSAVVVRRILGAVHQVQRTVLASQLCAARERKRPSHGRRGGRLSHIELHPETVRLARSLRWLNKRRREKRSVREISAELASQGHLTASGKPYGPSAVRRMLVR